MLRRVGTAEGATAWLESGLASLWPLVPGRLLTRQSVVCDHAGETPGAGLAGRHRLLSQETPGVRTTRVLLVCPARALLVEAQSACLEGLAREGPCVLGSERHSPPPPRVDPTAFSVMFVLSPAGCSQNTNRTCEECLKNVSVSSTGSACDPGADPLPLSPGPLVCVPGSVVWGLWRYFS